MVHHDVHPPLRACLRRWLHAFPGTTHEARGCYAYRLPVSPPLASPTQVCKLGQEERVWRTLRADDGTVQPLRSREIKAAVASHTQFEHMKKGGQRSSGKPTEGLTFLLQGASKITVPAIFPVTSNVIINCDSPEVPSAAKTQRQVFSRAPRDALCGHA